MAEYANNEKGFKEFLEEFSKREQPTDETPHPFSPQSSKILEHEIKGEILDWSLSLLDPGCPDFLKYLITREVAKTIFAEGMDKFKSESEYEEEEKDKEKEEKGEQTGDAETPETYYSTAQIARATFLTVYKVCAMWNKELPNCTVPALNTYSAHGIKNTRRKMEDKHVVITDLNTLLDLKDAHPTQYYAVFDGHGGLDASIYASKHLHVALARQESFNTDLEDALKKSILYLDNAYCKKSQRDHIRSGTTAVATVIRENFLYVAWIGDSQAVLVRGGKEIELMTPHKPERPDEKERIEKLGGCVIWFGAWRVNGSLSVSRAIGDPELKPFVCGDADTSKTELNSDDDDYLCIACDGFWDVFNGTQLAQMVSQHMQESGDKTALSGVLCDKAKEAGSSDNITVLIVFLRDVISVVEEAPKEQEKVENAGDDDVSPSDEDNGNSPAMESETAEEKDFSKPDTAPKGTVMVLGNKLQPSVKERPPHKLFVNKPQSISSKVNVLVTDTASHARLPHSVITHKTHWQKSPLMERRETRGSLFSLSSVESEEVTMPLTFDTENRRNINGLHAHGGFPTIIHPQRQRRQSPARNTPSPSVMSEPAMSGKGFTMAPYPLKPAGQKDTMAQKTFRMSITMNQRYLDDTSDAGGFGHQWPKLLRHASRSVPDHLSRLSKVHHHTWNGWPESHSQQRFGRKHPATYSFTRNPPNGFQKENIIPTGMPYNCNFLDTDIAITNSLYNKIKPKRSVGRRMSSGSLRHLSKVPIGTMQHKWHKDY